MRNLILSTLSTLALLIYPLSLSAQNTFSVSLDMDSAAGDQAVTSLNASADQVVAIQIFGNNIQNANGLAVRFEYDASQVTYEGFDTGDVLPNAHSLPEHGTNPTFIQISIVSFGGQATANSGLVGTIRFRTTAAFSGTAIRLVRTELGRGGQIASATLDVRVALQLSVSTAPSPDFNGDGTVGIPDFLEFVNHFGLSQGDAGYDAKYDLDSNDAIGISDFLIFVNSFGQQVPPSGGGGGSGNSPDLIVESPSVSDSTLTSGQSFTLSATVRNQGTGSSASTTLRYYRSSNSTISRSDTEVGTDSVNGLSASGTSDESISLTAPSNAGTYYYGACVESVSGESNTDNNCSDGVNVTVSALTSSYDLLIAPGETREYSKTFSDNFSFWGARIEYRVKSSTVDDGLSGLSDVNVSYKGYQDIGYTTYVNSIRFSYNLHVSSTVPLNTTLRATIVYDIEAGNNLTGIEVRKTYTVSLVVLVGGSGSPDLIPDANLRAVIADSLGKASGASITRAEMATLTRIDAPDKGIRNLTGLEHATNLTYLDLDRNSISDISALSNLTNLTVLSLRWNDISDISVLSNLTNLTRLNLHANYGNFSISVLSNLTNLTELSLGQNGISDISVLSNLTNLTELSLGGNRSISDISVLSNLTNLTRLNLWENSISDISVLSNLTNLTWLNLRDNNISDTSPLVANTGLGRGDEVDVRNNPLSATSLNTHIPTLQGRGVTVRFGSSKPAVEEKEPRMPRAAMKRLEGEEWEDAGDRKWMEIRQDMISQKARHESK